MSAIADSEVTAYVEENIGAFHERRLSSLRSLQLLGLLRRKNPYLFKSKNIRTVSELVQSLLDAHLTSQEETLFGGFLEGLAVYVAQVVHGGMKSSATGIDLEFEQDGARYLVAIKSGPNWGNSAQVQKMQADFANATRILRQGKPETHVVAVNGCCYGQDANPDKGNYIKLCGQAFWQMVSGDDAFYTRIIEPLGHRAARHNEAFASQYAAVVNQFSAEFATRFCTAGGEIDWPRLVAFTSARERPA